MGFITVDTSQIDLLRTRLQLVQQRIPQVVVDELDILATDVLGQLSDACPKGTGEGPGPAGDSDGPLAESFAAEVAVQGRGARLTITTTQPTKLKFVREGRGDVYPVRAKALYWQGLEHPVKHAGPSEANDFVTPIIVDAAATAAQLLAEAVTEEISLV